MPIVLECVCGKRLKARDEDVGKKVKCPGCGAILVVEAAPVHLEPVPAEPRFPKSDEHGLLEFTGCMFVTGFVYVDDQWCVVMKCSDLHSEDDTVLSLDASELEQLIRFLRDQLETIGRITRAHGN